MTDPDDTRCHGRRWLKPPAGTAPARSWLHTGHSWPALAPRCPGCPDCSSLDATIAEGQDAVRAALQAPRGAELEQLELLAALAELAPTGHDQLELLSACRLTLELLAELAKLAELAELVRDPLVERADTVLEAADALQDRLAREIAQLQQLEAPQPPDWKAQAEQLVPSVPRAVHPVWRAEQVRRRADRPQQVGSVERALAAAWRRGVAAGQSTHPHAAVEVLRTLEWSVRSGGYAGCPVCRGERATGHLDGCALHAALQGELPAEQRRAQLLQQLATCWEVDCVGDYHQTQRGLHAEELADGRWLAVSPRGSSVHDTAAEAQAAALDSWLGELPAEVTP